MITFNFKVQDRAFSFEESFLTGKSFGVQSVPRPYAVRWEEAAPVNFIEALLNENPRNLLLMDRNVYNLHCQSLKADAKRIMLIDATEDFKTLTGVEAVIDFLNARGFGKGETLIVAGGGITQDIGGLASALYKRGINWVLLPTTLLSMCDSCIGGKVGVNFKQVKNQLAIFAAPRQVVIMPAFIKTLEPREVKSGLGEALKLCITGGNASFDIFNACVKNGVVKNNDDFKKLIFTALGVKKQIIEADEFELDLRRSLNYGHTLGHALETLSNYAIPHGQAVVMGIIIVNRLAAARGMLKEEVCFKIKACAGSLFDFKPLSADITKQLPQLLSNDKKAASGAITFAVIKDIGDTVFLKLPIGQQLTAEIENIIKEEFGG